MKLWKKGILDLSKEVINVSKYDRHQYHKIHSGHCGSHQRNQPGTHQADQQLKLVYKVDSTPRKWKTIF